MLEAIFGGILQGIFWEIIRSLPTKIRIGCLFVLIAFVVIVVIAAALAQNPPA